MPKETDTESAQDQSGQQGCQKVAPKPQPRPERLDEEDGDICSPRVETSTEDDMPLA